MNTFPINLLLKNKRCLIVGGGKVAFRKLTSLLQVGANVTVVAPEISNKIKDAALNGELIFYEREFQENDLDGMTLVYLATGDSALNRAIIDLAEPHGVLVCSVDANWRKGSFITPASVSHNDISIAVSSHGVACRKTKLIKDNLARHIDSIENTGLLVVGTDHNHVGLDLRQSIHVNRSRMDKAGMLIMMLWGIQEFMLLNTCNRVEMIAAGQGSEAIIEMMRMILKLECLEKDQYYIKTGFEAFRHQCLVAAGLLSQTPGENHITAQFKDTYEYAVGKGWAGNVLKTLNDNILHVSKHIRTDVVPRLKVFEIEELAMAFLKKRMPDLKGKRILLAGTGCVGVSMKNLLIEEGCVIDWMYYSNKPKDSDKNVNLFTLDRLGAYIPEADIVISALATEEPVISMEMTELFKHRAEVIDLGTPRNVSHDLAQCGKINLTDMEDLKHWHRRSNCDMDKILAEANRIIDEHRDVYEKFRKSFIDGRQGQ
jgi:glutamyl-tRNA reductase